MELEQVKFKYLGNVFNLKNEAGKRKQMENKMNKIETQTCKHKYCNHVFFLSKYQKANQKMVTRLEMWVMGQGQPPLDLSVLCLASTPRKHCLCKHFPW
jgi:hypothetical protein